jgi:hypothetical protein
VPEVADAIARLGVALDRVRNQDGAFPPALHREGTVLLDRLLPQLGLHRLVRILAFFADTPDGTRLLAHLMTPVPNQTSAVGSIVVALNRQATMARFFAPDRVERLLAVCAEIVRGDETK